ncbi:lysozyme C, milk isozyme-like [Heteronotia binoei]|uniref:lysozyme C, milk isozyme-like n=1 Tax=Heteronotia binoei TaxID=13085 RepID=UPI00292DAFFC|nr:lysozyme C, milk isozyme-like [Heteronotia binoei]
MKILSLAALLLFSLIFVSEAKRIPRCEMVRILKKAGLDRYRGYRLENWICMAYYGSKFNSGAVQGPNRNGSMDYGMFQINSRWWCSNGKGKTANGCRTSCSKFVDDDIRDDILCAKRIVRNRKWRMNAWLSWRRYCKGRNLSHWTKGCQLSLP